MTFIAWLIALYATVTAASLAAWASLTRDLRREKRSAERRAVIASIPDMEAEIGIGEFAPESDPERIAAAIAEHNRRTLEHVHTFLWEQELSR